ncbi:MAG: hypothetical protein AAGA93_27240, partial [Actinomycetota bacterium]
MAPGRGPSRALAPLIGLLLAVAIVVVPVSPAAADPAGPTDYRTEIVAVEPATPAIELDIIGGDSFVELRSEPGTEVDVVGYEGEPYLRFDADGRVWQNDRSPSRWLNDDRYGGAEIPPSADGDAEPDWIEVADDGTYAWHDHRAHWMNPSRPLGAEPGDTILEAVIPLVVDDQAVAVAVRSDLLAPPSPVPALLGVASALPLAWLVWRRRTSGPAAAVAVAALVGGWAVLATVVGIGSVLGLPAEAAPGASQWLLPALAAVAVGAALLVVRRQLLAPPLRALVLPAALALAAVELLIWVWLRRESVVRALIPTVAPEWLDRLVVAGAAATGLVAMVAAAIAA